MRNDPHLLAESAGELDEGQARVSQTVEEEELILALDCITDRKEKRKDLKDRPDSLPTTGKELSAPPA
ncbi:UNVERIFIED_CONTAM: hypothetical protein K2H54_037356 [Gekko kuhli]